jgi:hypothetical protein
MSATLSSLRNTVNVKAHGPCPMCAQESWAGGDRISCVPELEAAGFPIEVLPFVCRNCGFVRLHAVEPLATIDD